MATNLPTIQPFYAGTNPSEAWRFWRQDFQDYVEALKYSEESEKTKTALFRHVCGEELKKQYRSFALDPIEDATEVSLLQILDEFDKQYSEYQNEIYAAFVFLEIKQKQGERFQEFYSRLRLAVEECNYENKTDRMLRDKIIQGLQDKPLQERLLRETSKKPKSLQEVVSECKAAEQSKAQASAMNETKYSVNVVSRNSSKQQREQQANRHMNRSNGVQQQPYQQQGIQKSCRSCGRSHEPRNCPAFGTTCKTCGFKNHWAACCQTKQKNAKNQKGNRRINVIDQQVEENIVYLGELKLTQTVNVVKSSEPLSQWYQEVCVNGNQVNFKLDTGAQVNVIPKQELLKWSEKPIVRHTKQPVLDYSDNEVPIIGNCTMLCKTDRRSGSFQFVVTSLNSSPILGLHACEKLGLVRRIYELENQPLGTVTPVSAPVEPAVPDTPEQVIAEFKDVFTGTGRMKRIVKIQLVENATPHVAAPRKIPLALHGRVKDELQHMVETGIITKVDEPTEWVSNMVVVDNAKKLRICIDPRPLNAAIKRPHYPIPSADRLFTCLQGCRVFTLLDAKNGFWHLPLDESSSYLTTFATPWGRFRFLVLPFGLNNAPEEFQRAMEELFENEPQVNPYFDDTALGSKTVEEHCKLLRRTLTIARNANLKFNPNKVQLSKDSITYLGHVISENGIAPDPQKVEAVNGFPTPQNTEDLQRFLGMVTYQAKFTPHLSSMTHSLRQLIKQDTAWVWDQNTQKDFDAIKETLMKAPCLRFFDNEKPVTLSVDASQFGLGAVLLQDQRPVAYGSASLTETQQRYAQIEKELLAVIYGLEHFNYYTYGRAIEVQTDHKPLLGLSKKPYDTISPRLQRMLLRMNRYEVTLTYVPGKQLITADALSRAPLKNVTFEEVQMNELTARVCLLAEASSCKWQEFKIMTEKDSTIQDILHHVRKGWPEEKANTKKEARPYWHCRDELHETEDGILCRGQRLVVPAEAHGDVLNKLHTAHRGITATKMKAREYFYWATMNSDIEDYIGNCRICQQHQPGNHHEPLVDRELPDRPWQKVGCDFFELQGKHYLLMIDYFSKFIEVQHMHGTTAQAVIETMKAIYARHGIPEELVSDQGPPFYSEAMREFNKEWNVYHNPSSPHYPRSNGQVERAIQTLKSTLRKAVIDGKDLHKVLLDYRITPTIGLQSPAELLMGRRLRSLLPSHPDRLKPNFDVKQVSKELEQRQEVQKKYGNRHTKNLPVLSENKPVWFRHKMNDPWKQGTVIKIGPQPRTYAIRTEDGKVYTRNRFYIRPDKTRVADDPVGNGAASQVNERNVEDLFPSQCVSTRVESPVTRATRTYAQAVGEHPISLQPVVMPPEEQIPPQQTLVPPQQQRRTRSGRAF